MISTDRERPAGGVEDACVIVSKGAVYNSASGLSEGSSQCVDSQDLALHQAASLIPLSLYLGKRIYYDEYPRDMSE